jgi:hypothetical protein
VDEGETAVAALVEDAGKVVESTLPEAVLLGAHARDEAGLMADETRNCALT